MTSLLVGEIVRNRKEKALVLSCACRGWSVWNFPPGGSHRPPGDQINRRWSLTDKEHRCSVALVLLPLLSPAAPHCTFIPDRTRLAGRGEEAQITLCIWKCGTFKVSSLIGRKVGVGSWWTLAVVSEQPSVLHFATSFCGQGINVTRLQGVTAPFVCVQIVPSCLR